MKIQDLTDAQLDKWVAKVQGFDTLWIDRKIGVAIKGDMIEGIGVNNYSPTTNDAQAMALVKWLYLEIHRPSDYWEVWGVDESGEALFVQDKNINRAICLAVVASVYGDEVEEVE